MIENLVQPRRQQVSLLIKECVKYLDAEASSHVQDLNLLADGHIHVFVCLMNLRQVVLDQEVSEELRGLSHVGGNLNDPIRDVRWKDESHNVGDDGAESNVVVLLVI